MGKKERDEVLSELSARIFSSMVDDALMDVVLESHQSIARGRKLCDVCHKYCERVHVPGASSSASHLGTKGATPSEVNSPAGTGTNTPANGRSNGNVVLDCVNCGRQLGSNRYASHLADCMGLNTRRAAARNASHKAKLGSDAGRSASPFPGTEDGMLSDEGRLAPVGKGKGKSKAKRADDAEFNLHRKRPGSPSTSPKKNAKKAKTSGSPMARVRGEADGRGSPSSLLPVAPTGSHSRIPSKLRESSILSSAQRDLSSSPEAPSRIPSPASTLASAPSLQSPTLSAKTPQKANGKKNKPIPPPPQRRPSPPRLPPPPVIRMPEPDYLVDVEGDETGSSTDTDSD